MGAIGRHCAERGLSSLPLYRRNTDLPAQHRLTGATPTYRRNTDDLDFALAISLEDYPAGLDTEPGFTRDALQEQRWIGPFGVAVDLLPAGPAVLEAGTLVWPDSGHEMNMTGFRHVFDRRITLSVADDLDVDLAPVAVLALLKMVAFLDRPGVRDNDLVDLADVLEHYLDEDDDRRWTDESVEIGTEYDETAAFVLGQDLAGFTRGTEVALVRRFSDKLLDEDDEHLSQERLVQAGPLRWRDHPEDAVRLIRALRAGLETRG